ncbi:TRAP transporter substrate-binding protein [Roseospira marina]|uniref:TRAP transporter substrate-binding protein n=1 Tax=Roseospira marina TaxID=140057 RepID=A0A5M6IBY3_9PROT|nr:TRAP transporter substrate-binding protein [Roseospira marina]KAA5605467.1 TRAP transporter substrate-binding protein [Roseospira marina]MBB4314531.1 tripartite ATP-independent transporter DctP family solute receptor [Roseospira marina]MBB5088641.1 tripartite ATP-independent transporter DctP family solute receptor [Roseospira marina]
MRILSTTLATAAVAVIGLSASAQAEEIIFAHGANAGNPRFDAANLFAELVPGCSHGDMTVNVAPSATMGDDAEMLTSVTAGVIQMTANSQGAMSQVVPEFGMLGLPFLFKDLPTVWRVLDGKVGEELDRITQERGMKIVGFWDNGIRHVTHVSKFVPTPADIEGMKIRTPPGPVTIAVFEAMGANPAPLAWSELPTALRSGAFEGQENPLTNIYTARLHEITPYITMTGHLYETTPVLASLGWWNGLSEEERTCVQDSVDQAGWFQRGRSLMDNVQLRATMTEEGAKFMDIDREPFQKATESVYTKYEGEYGDFIALLRQEVDALETK